MLLVHSHLISPSPKLFSSPIFHCSRSLYSAHSQASFSNFSAFYVSFKSVFSTIRKAKLIHWSEDYEPVALFQQRFDLSLVPSTREADDLSFELQIIRVAQRKRSGTNEDAYSGDGE